ncbi:MAG: mechanosensitive ion channel domain-containing protein [Candidatus Saccharibacteria bacterium]
MGNFVLINTQKVTTQFLNILNNYGPRFLRAILFLILGILFMRLFSILLDKIIDLVKLSFGLKEIMTIIIKGIFWVLLGVGVLQILGLSNVAITAGALAAAVSFGLSQGLTPTVRDLLAGLQLSSDHDFRIGDEVEVGQKDLRVRGYIIEIDTKKIRIIDKYKKLHVLPNSLVDENEWTLLERDDVELEHLGRSDIIKVIHHKIKKRS